MTIADDTLHDSGLAGRYAEVATEQPSAQLDEAILKGARESAADQRDAKNLPFVHQRWVTPIAAAASVLVVLGSVRLMTPGDLHPTPMEPEAVERPSEEADESVADPSIPVPSTFKAESVKQIELQKQTRPVQASAGIAAPPQAPAAETSTQRSAAEWRTLIEGLIDRGELTMAKSALAEFAGHYPDHPDIDSLRGRLE